VVVVDIDTEKVVGDIPDTPGVHGIAVAPELNRGFISNGRGNTATIFDLKTLKTLGQVKTGTNPDGILYEPATKRVLTLTAGVRTRRSSTPRAERSWGRLSWAASRSFRRRTAKAGSS